MKKLFIIILFLPFILFSQNQNNANWFFGDSVMLNFNDGIITPMQVPGFADEACVSYSDNEGNLLFYSDGSFVWNKELEIMDNSPIEIDQYTEGKGSSITQGSLIITDPSNSTKYYIINHADDALKYSIVDMTINDGLGDIIVDKKNILISEGYFTQKLQAVKHANGRDWWVLFHRRIPSFDEDSSNAFYKLLITPEGLSGPFEQNIGIKRNEFYVGQMVFSPDGNLLAYPDGNDLEIFNFDRCTGELSEYKNVISINGPAYFTYGCSFSPDGRLIYVSCGISGSQKLYQFCLSCSDTLENTRKLIYNHNIDEYVIAQHLLGPDNKIYFTIVYNIQPSSVFTDWNTNLSVINDPNNEGSGCNLDTATISLGGLRAISGLPNMPNYNLGALAGSECDTLDVNINTIINKNEITIYPNPATDNLFIKTNNIHFSSLIFHLTDATGKNILAQNITSDNTKINITPFSNGIYFISIKQHNEIIYSDSFVKQ